MRTMRLALDLFLHNGRRTVLSIFVVCFCVLLVTVTVALDEGVLHGYRTADQLFQTGYDRVASVTVDAFGADGKSFFTKEYGEFFDAIAALDGVAACGTVVDQPVSSNVTNPDGLYGLQLLQGQYFGDTTTLHRIGIDTGLLNLVSLDVAKGTPVNALDFSPRNGKAVKCIYLGGGYGELPKRTVYEDSNIVYEIVGVLAEHQRWFDGRLVQGADLTVYDYTIPLSNRMLVIQDRFPESNSVFLSVTADDTLDNVLPKIYDIAKQYDAELHHFPLSSSFERTYADVLSIRAILMRLLFITLTASVCMLICMQQMDAMQNIHDFGVMIAVGFSTNDICRIVVCKNLLIAGAALLLSTPVSILFTQVWYPDCPMRDIICSILLWHVLPMVAVVLMTMITCSTIATIRYLCKFSPVQMLGGYHDSTGSHYKKLYGKQRMYPRTARH